MKIIQIKIFHDMENSKTILNSSEHLFNLSFSETLMLRNYARSKNLSFCSMIGGAESIRDIQEARNFSANAFEFNMIESFFAIYKICSAIEKVFNSNNKEINKLFININITSPCGIELINDIESLKLPDGFRKSNFIFNLDRRAYAKNVFNLPSNDFEYFEYEEKINPLIVNHLTKLKQNSYKSSISGGMNKESLKRVFNNKVLPDYIKTGLFSMLVEDFTLNKLSKKVKNFQITEAKILRLMREKMYFRYNYLNERNMHLDKYLMENNY